MFLTLLNLFAWIWVIVLVITAAGWLLCLPFRIVAKIIAGTAWHKRIELKRLEAANKLAAQNEFPHFY